MSPELIGILAVGAALAGVTVASWRDIRADMHKLDERLSSLERAVATLGERVARIEGVLFHGPSFWAGPRDRPAED